VVPSFKKALFLAKKGTSPGRGSFGDTSKGDLLECLGQNWLLDTN
jgi:hypothetical protein